MDYDKLSDWENDHYEDLIEGFLEEHQDLWGQYVLREYEESKHSEADFTFERLKYGE